jgi:hypothetical protein
MVNGEGEWRMALRLLTAFTVSFVVVRERKSNPDLRAFPSKSRFTHFSYSFSCTLMHYPCFIYALSMPHLCFIPSVSCTEKTLQLAIIHLFFSKQSFILP